MGEGRPEHHGRRAPRPKTQKLIYDRSGKLVGLNAIFIASGVRHGLPALGLYMNFGVLLLDDIVSQGAGRCQD
ncbi:hypothetical protein PINS_up024012 [Pythium insidiosum]|nr:hypothetical protein PINS_up024012 [Pythium insidiosum]